MNRKRGFLSLAGVVIVMISLIIIVMIGIGEDHLGSMRNIHLGLDLAGGVSVTYEAVEAGATKEQMDDTVYKIQKRVQDLNTESAVYKEGLNRINVDIPGISNANQILSRLGNAGSIQFTDENGNLIIDGSDIATAKPQILQSNFGTEYIVELTLNQSGKIKFGKATKENIGKTISIIYDGEVIYSPKVEDEITMGQAQISGQESFEEAEKLASSIRIGALPLELKEIRSNVVGAKLGSQAVTTSLTAGFYHCYF